MIPARERTLGFRLKKLRGADLVAPLARLARAPRRRALRAALAGGRIRRVLFTAYSRGFGDILIFAYALAAFRARHPGIGTALALRGPFAPLAGRLGLADRVADLERDAELVAGSAPDAVVDLSVEGSREARRLLAALAPAYTLSFFNPEQGLRADRWVRLDRGRLLAEQYFDLLAPFDVAPYAALPRLAFTGAERAAVRKLTAPLGRRPLVGFAPGSRLSNLGMERRWPPERYAALVAAVVARRDVTCVLVGAPDEREYCESIAGAARNAAAGNDAARVVNLAGAFDYLGNACLISRMAAFVSNDSSPMHLAALCGVPGVHFVKNGIDPWRPAPFPPAPRLLLEFDDAREIPLAAAAAAFDELAAEAGLPLRG